MREGLDRRDFMRWGMMLGGAAAALTILPKGALAADTAPVKLEECLGMSPLAMAEKSARVQESWKTIQAAVSGIGDRKTRELVEGILANPAPTFMERYADESSRKALRKDLLAAGLLDEKAVPEGADFPPGNADPKKPPQPFLSAPGSGYQSHHAYPGGVVTHTALNLKVSMALFQGYTEIYGYSLDKDAVIASQALHDLHKPWVFQWKEDGASRTELTLAGTGEHHTYSIAESMYRGLPPRIVVAQACAHQHPGTEKDEAESVGWIKAAAILAGKDPVKEGYLSQSGSTLPVPRLQENFVCHLGDHDFVLTVPAAKWTIAALGSIAVKHYGMTEADLKGKKFNAFRNYVFAQATIMKLYQDTCSGGEEALTREVKGLVTV